MPWFSCPTARRISPAKAPVGLVKAISMPAPAADRAVFHPGSSRSISPATAKSATVRKKVMSETMYIGNTIMYE
jgi:hypothetical protein